MQSHFKGFYQYCKGAKLKDIATSQGVSIDLVKTWMTRYNWVAKREACREPDGTVNLEKAHSFLRGKGNVEPVGDVNRSDEISQRDINTRLQTEDNPVNDGFKKYVSNVLTNSVRYLAVPTVTNDEDLRVRVDDYFITCIKEGLIPTVEGLWLCLGIQKSTFYDWCSGKRGTVRAEYCKRARLCIQECTTQLAMSGNIDKILYIFLSKNHFGLSDRTEVEITHNNALGAEKSKEELLSELNDTPQEDSFLEADFNELIDDFST